LRDSPLRRSTSSGTAAKKCRCLQTKSRVEENVRQFNLVLLSYPVETRADAPVVFSRLDPSTNNPRSVSATPCMAQLAVSPRPMCRRWGRGNRVARRQMDERAHARRPARQRPRAASDALRRRELHQNVLVNDGKVIWTYQTGRATNTTTCGCFPTATSFSRGCNTSPKSRRTKKWSGVTIATTAAAPITRKSTPASPSVGQGDVRPERPAAPADGRQHQDRRGGGQSRGALAPTASRSIPKHSRAVPPRALHRAGNLSRFLSQ
jgi:hypothetical protein